MQQLSKICLTTMLACYVFFFLKSLSLTIKGSLGSYSNVRFCNDILGSPVFDLSYIICLINDICLIDVEIGLITIAGPLIPLLETFTLSTKGWSYCLIHNENGVSSYYFTLVVPLDSSFTSSPKPFKVLYTSSVSVSTFENFSPSKVSNYLKIISSTGDVQIKTGTPAFVKE